MGKNPAFQFYPGDWFRDPQLRMASLTARAIWIDMLCCMWWSKERGTVTGTVEELTRMAGALPEDFNTFLQEAKRCGFANVTERNGNITVVSRRMVVDEKARVSNRERQQRHRSNKDITALSQEYNGGNNNSVTSMSGDGDGVRSKELGNKDSGNGEGIEKLQYSWNKYFGSNPTPAQDMKLAEFMRLGKTVDEIDDAIRIAAENKIERCGYIEGILFRDERQSAEDEEVPF